MFDKKFKSAIQKYLEADTKSSRSGAKGAITRLINSADSVDILLIPEILQQFQELPEWLKLRFKRGSLYQEGGRVFGWYKDSQIQAVELPVTLETFSHDDGENFRIVKYIKVTHEEMGFAPAINLPFNGTYVDVQPSDDNFLELLEAGWSSPCPLQWSWFERPTWTNLEGYVVERSIIPCGFWQAWKWWPDCWQWYLEKRPELFGDADLWVSSVEVRHSPPNDPYAAVLGNASRGYYETFRLDD